MEPFRQEKGSSMASWSTFIFKSVFLSWFRQDNFFSGECNIKDKGLNDFKLKTWWMCFLQTCSFWRQMDYLWNIVMYLSAI